MEKSNPKFSVLLDMDELTAIACLVDGASCSDSNTVAQTVLYENLLRKLDSILLEYDEDDTIILSDPEPDEPPSNVIFFGDV